MKKIIGITMLMILVPFFIVTLMDTTKIEEIELKYINNVNVRVKRLKTDTIETIPLEEYIVGVLAGEMPIYFNIEALKAQAVASRSYVLKRIEYNKEKDYDVIDSTTNQVYLDLGYLKESWQDQYTARINKLRKAVNETIDEYLTYDNEVIDALFFSTSNGYTEDSIDVFNIELPYLKSVESSWDEEVSTTFYSKKTMSLQEFYEKLNLTYQKKLIIEILEKSNTNRINKLKINGNEFKSRDVYNLLSLKSTDFKITQVGSNILIETTGYGHGVGMSQYGAEAMALKGYNYEEILKYYYTDVDLKKIQN